MQVTWLPIIIKNAIFKNLFLLNFLEAFEIFAPKVSVSQHIFALKYKVFIWKQDFYKILYLAKLIIKYFNR